MGDYAHVLISIPLYLYCQAVVDSCTRLHEVLQLAHKPGLAHLYDIPMAQSDDYNGTLVDVLVWGEVTGELHSYKNANVGTSLTMDSGEASGRNPSDLARSFGSRRGEHVCDRPVLLLNPGMLERQPAPSPASGFG